MRDLQQDPQRIGAGSSSPSLVFAAVALSGKTGGLNGLCVNTHHSFVLASYGSWREEGKGKRKRLFISHTAELTGLIFFDCSIHLHTLST
jgi:hypothetical protein